MVQRRSSNQEIGCRNGIASAMRDRSDFPPAEGNIKIDRKYSITEFLTNRSKPPLEIISFPATRKEQDTLMDFSQCDRTDVEVGRADISGDLLHALVTI
jgi:hypothetical protein